MIMCEYSFNPYYRHNPKWDGNEFSFLKNNDMLDFHKSISGYEPTPLLNLHGLAKTLNIKELWVKDESFRYGIKAFKALGASYSIYKFLQKKWISKFTTEFNLQSFTNFDILDKLGSFTFCAATDGNHGKAVAWTANKLAQKCVIYMPSNTAESRIKNIQVENAKVILVDGTFDDCVTQCERDANENGWQPISDTAYPGNMELPGYILRGYSTLFTEMENEINLDEKPKIDFVFLQAGVGALAAAGASYYTLKYKEKRPKIICIEPISSDCFLESIKYGKGKSIATTKPQDSIMAGLNCGIPSALAWPIVRDAMDLFLSVSDNYAKMAMKSFHSGIENDPVVTSGESGAAGLAGLLALLNDKNLEGVKSKLGLNSESRILVINTEGDTDPANYKKIINEMS